MNTLHIVMILASFGAAMAGVFVWRSIALRFDIVAIANNRSLHVGRIPVGSGIVFAVVWLATIACAYAAGWVGTSDFLALFIGGVVLAALGLHDDATDSPALTRLLVHIIVVTPGLVWIGGFPAIPVFGYTVDLGWFGYVIGFLAGLWMITLINFMDGVDGMLASGAIVISVAMGTFLHLEGDTVLSVLLYSLAAGLCGFLWFNWPPAKIFMGDAGSTFLGYVFFMLILITTREHPDLFWVWMIVLGYFFTETTLTLVLRLMYLTTFRDLYKPHRDHAYQSLARRTENHLLVTRTVLMIEVFWLLPMAALAYSQPNLAMVVFIASITPVGIFVAKQGVFHALR